MNLLLPLALIVLVMYLATLKKNPSTIEWKLWIAEFKVKFDTKTRKTRI